MFIAQAKYTGRRKPSPGNSGRPRRQLSIIGSAYEILRATTDAALMALNAVVDSKKMHPKSAVIAVVKQSALNGRPDDCTWAKMLLAGRPPSRAKA